MASPVLTENNILDIVYSMYEGDTTNWSTTSDEYLAARVYANAGINRWEFYDQTNWRELWVSLDDAASTVTKTLTADTYDYTCPDDMIKPASYVRTQNSTSESTYWDVIQVDRVPSYVKDDEYRYCYFTGNLKDGFTLHFNPLIDLTTGDSIKYEYYKAATKFTAITSKTEMSDPYFIVYFVLSRLYENDGEDGRASKAFQESEARLEAMRTVNMVGLEGVDELIPDTITNSGGFGT